MSIVLHVLAVISLTSASSRALPQVVPEPAQKALYCADVLLALSVEEEDAEAKARHLESSTALNKLGVRLLIEAGWNETMATLRVGSFGEEVEEAYFGDGTLRFSVPDCMTHAATAAMP
ncbi:MAG: hypothetical protein EON56_04670 [Alphaproteobacteria bacterium]|nr:MAG: hypothetical protein EON56_04670 [Alphaproteobacteria bacterium]